LRTPVSRSKFHRLFEIRIAVKHADEISIRRGFSIRASALERASHLTHLAFKFFNTLNKLQLRHRISFVIPVILRFEIALCHWNIRFSSRKLLAMNIVFLGSGAFGIPSLNALADSAHRILHIISQPDRPAGRGKLLTPTAVSQWALDRHAPLTATDNANAPEILELVRAIKPDCLVVIAFGQKLSEELLATAPHRAVNLHSSLLPKYRGAAPINWAIINGDPVAGVCVIDVTGKMDAGDILASASTAIGPAETAGELHDRLAALGAPLLPEVLSQFGAGTATRSPQDQTVATRAPKLSRELAWIDFRQPAAVASARIRGLSPWPGVQVQLIDPAGKPATTATLLKCQAISSSAAHAPQQCGLVLPDRTIACVSGSIEILTLQPPGKKPMPLAAFANGHPYAPGAKLRSLMPPPVAR
jgi:methionyl-tRNA formyltransferase